MYLAEEDVRNNTALAMSVGSPNSFNAILFNTSLENFSELMIGYVIRVFIYPAATALTRIDFSAHFIDRVLISCTKPPLPAP